MGILNEVHTAKQYKWLPWWGQWIQSDLADPLLIYLVADSSQTQCRLVSPSAGQNHHHFHSHDHLQNHLRGKQMSSDMCTQWDVAQVECYLYTQSNLVLLFLLWSEYFAYQMSLYGLSNHLCNMSLIRPCSMLLTSYWQQITVYSPSETYLQPFFKTFQCLIRWFSHAH